jgi:hypothetical protein
MRTNDCLSSEWIKKIRWDEMHSYRKYKTWSEVSFWMPNISSIEHLLLWSESSFTWPYNINNAHDIFLNVDDLKATRVITVKREHCLFPVINIFHIFCNWWIHFSCTWSFWCTIHHMLLWQVVILRWSLPYLCFAFICLFQVDKSSCCLTNSCSCWTFIFQLRFC